MATVNLINVGKKHGQHIILDGISLQIEKGEFVAVVGPSGCGKSTLLRLVAGLDTVSQGKILINEQCVNEIPPSRRDMAMVFQNYALYPHMTVFQNMAYGLKMRRMKKNDIQRRVQDVADMLHLSDYLQRKPGELSGGQRQRVAMGRAIVRSPSVFLFDEPLSNLDTKLRTEMRYEIKKLHRQLQTTCLYVTHDQTEAMTMASRVLVLNQGRVEQIAAPQDLYRQPASLFVASFTGHYPINFLDATVDLANKRIVTIMGNEYPLPVLQEGVRCGERVILGVRPEHFELTGRGDQNAIPVRIELVDNMGADKLIHVRSHCGQTYIAVKTSASTEVKEADLAVKMMINKVSLFHKETGKRLGGWDEQER
ncbi:ABC transporter ATP-binding protein [Legionella spiritensis]|uniref:sn-glycerol-3-phosphate transport, ATP binding protein n=1 Tax=Legionella spiritensis TaxID=452 RepID=A0A0W0Z6Q6_LEGSP|nr:sn-glycerol-3-phosphate ABC transporter ATP-binding protein UgpC [Legionella spiritensis]KTD64797.1 sn-glycerol-3-phosphate transport, ATP binding protein [Legionella spiritensis]SNV39890.1 sn-glycerol 3-phosphate transport system ATP-binding protein [Legionella spiritensis]VEG90438.1 sn-glycerol 3-phosphate transport system ATP-binding protein [Legionella spiritensis]